MSSLGEDGSAFGTQSRGEGVVQPLRESAPLYAALDLGTNNCRLLVARPSPGVAPDSRDNLRVVDAFSRIVRLGEGVSLTGRLCERAIWRTIEALKICRDKMERRNVTHARLIATEACRAAVNGADFVARVKETTGLSLEVVDRETEARLAATGCSALADPQATGVLLFDIGGGSTEIVWLGPNQGGSALTRQVTIWTSIELGVVTLAEQFGGENVGHSTFEAMVSAFSSQLESFASSAMKQRACDRFHLLGTSGTVTTIAGIHLDLLRYDRRRVDGLWLSAPEIDNAVSRLRSMSYEQRSANGCIGADRADLVLAGCAILESIRRAFPAPRIRIADRGLREGILIELMQADRSLSDSKTKWTAGGGSV